MDSTLISPKSRAILGDMNLIHPENTVKKKKKDSVVSFNLFYNCLR